MGRASSTAGAQKLEPGKWTGTLSWFSAIRHRLDAIYDMRVEGDTIAIMGRFNEPNTGEGFSSALNDVEVIGDTLTFWVSPGKGADRTHQAGLVCWPRSANDHAALTPQVVLFSY